MVVCSVLCPSGVRALATRCCHPYRGFEHATLVLACLCASFRRAGVNGQRRERSFLCASCFVLTLKQGSSPTSVGWELVSPPPPVPRLPRAARRLSSLLTPTLCPGAVLSGAGGRLLLCVREREGTLPSHSLEMVP